MKDKENSMQKLTKQEAKFVEIKAETGNGTKAAQEAFGIEDSNYAGVKAHELLRNPKIVNAIEEALPDELLAQVHLEGLNATRGIDGAIELPDYAVRHKYLDSAYKLKGSYAAEKSIVVNAQVNIENKQYVESIVPEVINKMKQDESNG